LAFECDIVTPDREVFQQTVSGVVLPAHDGLVGILTNRAPLLVKLGEGTLTAHLPGGAADRTFSIRGGVAQMKGNKLTVLTEKADE
jgi:F-type H+-transporting ATPase subunit epsilon